MTPADALWGLVLDGRGAAREFDPLGPEITLAPGETWWCHIDRGQPVATAWLRERGRLDAVMIDALLASETRPRAQSHGDGHLLVLRGANQNPGHDADDLVTLRLFVRPGQVISSRQRPIMAARVTRAAALEGQGPTTTGDLVVRIIGALLDRIGPLIDELEEESDNLEEQVINGESTKIRASLADLRQRAIGLRRYLAPQRDALARLVSDDAPWLESRERMHLREALDRTVRFVEDLDQVRERAQVVQDELMNRLSEQMNRNMYVLSVVSAIMLPLGVLTGLLGINVGGIPGADDPRAFDIVVIGLVVIVVLQILLYRVKRWL